MRYSRENANVFNKCNKQYAPYDPASGYDYPLPHLYHLTTVAIMLIKTSIIVDKVKILNHQKTARC